MDPATLMLDGSGNPVIDLVKQAAKTAIEDARLQVITNQATRLNQIKTLISATPGTLTNVQRDAILIHLVKQALGQ